MKYKCSCPPDSPFHWRDNPRPSMFALDPNFKASVQLSQNQTSVVERARLNGKDISHLAALSSNREQRILNIKQFTVFSHAKTKAIA